MDHPDAIRKMVIVAGVHGGNLVESIDMPFARWLGTFIFRQPFTHPQSLLSELFANIPSFLEKLEQVKLSQIRGGCERNLADVGETVLIDSFSTIYSNENIEINTFSLPLLMKSLSQKIDRVATEKKC